MKKDDLRQKVLQKFILGYKGISPNDILINLVKENLGGVIFFAENLVNRKEFQNTISNLNSYAQTPLFLSIDQEGGLVERTIFLDEKVEYISPCALAKITPENVYKHYNILAKDLVDLGLNFNFAPDIDVNTNPHNPVIFIRSFSSDEKNVSKFAKIELEAFKDNDIISCAKHFIGHGDCDVDSHLNMPEVQEDFNHFLNKHACCFKDAVQNNVDTIMVSHIWFSFFNEVKRPCSLSKEAIEIFLKQILKFKGLIISDDMVMGGISKHYGLYESIKMAIEAGIDILIFRNATDELINVIDKIVDYALTNNEFLNKILNSDEKIRKFKKEKLKHTAYKPEMNFDIKQAQKNIDEIAESCVRINFDNNMLPIQNSEKVLILSPDYSQIYNLQKNKNLSDFMKQKNVEEKHYPPECTEVELNKILSELKNIDKVIFIAYNAYKFNKQVEIFNHIKLPKILVNCGVDFDVKLFSNPDCLISLNCPKTSCLKALAKVLV